MRTTEQAERAGQFGFNPFVELRFVLSRPPRNRRGSPAVGDHPHEVRVSCGQAAATLTTVRPPASRSPIARAARGLSPHIA